MTNIKDLIICILVIGVLVLLGVIIVGDYVVASQLDRALDDDVMELMKMALTGLVGIISGYLGASK
tara:strand:+ start:360 stop:557 length:198 start_codon:yes stop_codon:yes gene_type:complete